MMCPGADRTPRFAAAVAGRARLSRWNFRRSAGPGIRDRQPQPKPFLAVAKGQLIEITYIYLNQDAHRRAGNRRKISERTFKSA